jgi:glycosyltransferase involved in cell wall biosynthesis
VSTTEHPKVALVGTSPPRRCGIATFTDDLRRALTDLHPAAPAVQVALTDREHAYDYGESVVFEINDTQISDYRAAAELVNSRDIDVVCVQHEFGIFGGPAGRHVDELLEHVDAPVVTTLHTVLADPPPALRAATRRLADRSDRLVVLAEQAVELLVDGYGIDADDIRLIPHGIPDLPSIDAAAAKEAIGAGGRTVLLTFGLLGPSKGIDVALQAMPEIVAAFPDVVYLVLGATHPHVLRDHGEAYRQSLEQRVRDLGLERNVTFVDRYADLDELCLHLAATDVYLTPYRSADQIVSGTLAYAVGMGRSVVSTPYRYAVELLAEGRGALVPFGDAHALAGSVTSLLGDAEGRAEMQRRAFEHGRQMTWPAVARAYEELFVEVVASHERRPAAWSPVSSPPPRFDFLREMTDDTGVFQHAAHGIPSRAHGYCTDDVSRALVAAVQGAARCGDPTAAGLIPTYLSFLADAQREDGSFENLLAFDRRFVPGTASQDTLGQAMWGLGSVVAEGTTEGSRRLAAELLDRSLPRTGELTDTRAMSYAVAGLACYLDRFPGALGARRTMERLAGRLADRLAAHSSASWQWFDDALTYANAKVCEALLLAGRSCDHAGWSAAGLATLDFLLDATFSDGRFDFVGNDGWQGRDGSRATFGQQPIEAGYTAQACTLAYEVTGDERYLERARAAVEWLLGRNRLGIALYDPATGRCADGLDRHGASDNAGGESVACALLGLLALPAPLSADGAAAPPAATTAT